MSRRRRISRVRWLPAARARREGGAAKRLLSDDCPHEVSRTPLNPMGSKPDRRRLGVGDEPGGRRYMTLARWFQWELLGLVPVRPGGD